MIWTRSGRLPMFAATNSASAFTAASRALVSGFSAVSFLASALAAALFIGSFCLLLWRERLASTSLAARRFGALLLRHTAHASPASETLTDYRLPISRHPRERDAVAFDPFWSPQPGLVFLNFRWSSHTQQRV